LGIAAGSAIAILCLAVGKWLIAGIIPFRLAWIVGVTGLVVAASNWRLLGRGFAWSMAVAFIALLAPVPWPASWLVQDAERIADGSPYCIQVAEAADYQQARSWLDFSPIRMRSWYEGGQAMQFHAILAVGSGPNREIYNWSYWSMSWRDATPSRAPAVVSCMPKLSFAAQLPYVFPAPPEERDTVHLRLAGRSFNIPASYRPRATRAASNPQLGIILDASRFAPAEMICDRGCANLWAIFYFNPAGVISWLNGPTTDRTRIMEESTGPDGRITTRIDCSPARTVWLNCRHYFLHDGVMFYVNMSEVDLGAWRQVQHRLIVLFRDLQRPT
jgi:hypothetical protein